MRAPTTFCPYGISVNNALTAAICNDATSRTSEVNTFDIFYKDLTFRLNKDVFEAGVSYIIVYMTKLSTDKILFFRNVLAATGVHKDGWL